MTDSSPQEKPGFLNKALKVLAYPVAATTGWYYAHKEARNGVYDTLKHTPFFEETLRGDHHKEIEKIVQSVAKDTPARMSVEHLVYDKKVTTFMKARGFKNTLNFFDGLSGKQKLDTAMTAITAAGITLGVILSIANSKGLLDRISRIGHKSDDQTPGIS